MSNTDDALASALAWADAALGGARPLADETREHPGERASAVRLRSAGGLCYLKLHRDESHWHAEVHAYERWAAALGGRTPRLLAVRDEAPLALVVTALPGRPMHSAAPPASLEAAVWREAGAALAQLHGSARGAFFGACRRDGSPQGARRADAAGYLLSELERWLPGAGGTLGARQLRVVDAVRERLPAAFAGEPAAPCHRDYCTENWLVAEDGGWAGVIDYEFSAWDVRATDIARDPAWTWIERPELDAALRAGYASAAEPPAEEQLLLTRAIFAVSAVGWGVPNSYFGFAAEGRRALDAIAERLGL